MDLLAIVYSLFLSMILGSPFLYFLLHREEKQSGRNLIDLKNERRILMENLRDLKTDFETGKFSRDEFEVSSSEIIQQLERIDSELKELEISCPKCNALLKQESKFCPDCGQKLSP